MNKEINGRVYSFGTLPATQAVRVEVAIASAIGEPLFKAFTEAGGKFDLEDKAAAEAALGQAAMSAMGLVAANMDADELLKTMVTLFSTVTCDGKRFDMDTQFTGRNRELWEVFLAAIRHNFADFLPASLFNSGNKKIPA